MTKVREEEQHRRLQAIKHLLREAKEDVQRSYKQFNILCATLRIFQEIGATKKFIHPVIKEMLIVLEEKEKSKLRRKEIRCLLNDEREKFIKSKERYETLASERRRIDFLSQQNKANTVVVAPPIVPFSVLSEDGGPLDDIFNFDIFVNNSYLI